MLISTLYKFWEKIILQVKMNLPDGVILEILTQAQHDDIRTLCSVNKQFKQLCSDPKIYRRILELRDIVRARKVEKLLQLKPSFPHFWETLMEILPSAALNEYYDLLWVEIIKFVERHPELNNEFDIFFGILDYSDPRKALNDWLSHTNWPNVEYGSELIYEQLREVIRDKSWIGHDDLTLNALRQLFLKHPDYTNFIHQAIINYKEPSPPVKGDSNFPGWNFVAPRI